MLLSYRDAEFWQNFYTHHWKPQVPTVLRQPFKVFPFSEAVLFRAMRGYEERLRAGDQRIPCLVSVADTVRAPRRPLRQLFRQKSESLEQLEQACGQAFPKTNFGFMLNDMQAVDPGIWSGVSAFLQDAFPWIGFPVPRAFFDLFYGNYSSTFTGLHKDTQEIIAFVVRGEKRILAWPFDYFLNKVEGLGPGAKYFNKRLPIDHRPYRQDALVLDARAGDIIYWPSDYWHVAEAQPGRFSAMISLGLVRPDAIQSQTASERPRSAPPSQDMTDSTDRAGAAEYFRRMTGLGFQLGSPMAETPGGKRAPSPANAAVVKTKNSIILWRVDRPLGRLLVASNGHSATLPYSAELVTLLEHIAQGEAVSLPKTTKRRRDVPSKILETQWNPQRVLKTRALNLGNDPVAGLVDWLLRAYAVEWAQ